MQENNALILKHFLTLTDQQREQISRLLNKNEELYREFAERTSVAVDAVNAVGIGCCWLVKQVINYYYPVELTAFYFALYSGASMVVQALGAMLVRTYGSSPHVTKTGLDFNQYFANEGARFLEDLQEENKILQRYLERVRGLSFVAGKGASAMLGGGTLIVGESAVLFSELLVGGGAFLTKKVANEVESRMEELKTTIAHRQ